MAMAMAMAGPAGAAASALCGSSPRPPWPLHGGLALLSPPWMVSPETRLRKARGGRAGEGTVRQEAGRSPSRLACMAESREFVRRTSAQEARREPNNRLADLEDVGSISEFRKVASGEPEVPQVRRGLDVRRRSADTDDTETLPYRGRSSSNATKRVAPPRLSSPSEGSSPKRRPPADGSPANPSWKAPSARTSSSGGSSVRLPWVPGSSSSLLGVAQRRLKADSGAEARSLPGGPPLPPWLSSPESTTDFSDAVTSASPTRDLEGSTVQSDSDHLRETGRRHANEFDNRFQRFPSKARPSGPSQFSGPSKDSFMLEEPRIVSQPASQSDLLPKVFPPPRKKKPRPPPLPETLGDAEVAPMDIPFEFKYSYTEEPDVAPIGYREPQFSPFGPNTMSRPWTGGPPLKKSKKNKLPRLILEFDSFTPPPGPKKGVKPVEAPGPYLEGVGPQYVRSREEVLGDPLTEEEKVALIEDCNKGNRQVNLGRDGLIHNMLDLIHSHWKRRRVAKIRCKGVPTVDMDKVCRELEDKTGGQIIHRAGGVVYLFRGRNYNYKLRPRLPLMLWKPPAPIYPRLIVDTPGGLTKDEANELRLRGRQIRPVARLGKNGVYLNLVEQVQKNFEHSDLVKVDCTGLDKSDYKKIGAKLKTLVPCVLLSFEKEQILMWRGPPGGIVDAPEDFESSDKAAMEAGYGFDGAGETVFKANSRTDTADEQSDSAVDAEEGDEEDDDWETENEDAEVWFKGGQEDDPSVSEFERLWEEAKVSGAMTELSLSETQTGGEEDPKGGAMRRTLESESVSERWPGPESSGDTLADTVLAALERHPRAKE